MSRIHSLLLFIPAAVLITGCFALPDARSPTTGAVATGEPLAVVDDVKVWTTTSKEKVGETVYKDRSGATIATADTYEERTRVHSMQVWYPVQGDAQIPDEDFFRIAGEQAAFEETMRMRARAHTWNRRGKLTMGAGLVGFVVGVVLPHPVGRSILITAGGIAVSTGWYMAHWGAKQMAPENHAVDRSTAERAARQYNQQLGSVGVAVGRSF